MTQRSESSLCGDFRITPGAQLPCTDWAVARGGRRDSTCARMPQRNARKNSLSAGNQLCLSFWSRCSCCEPRLALELGPGKHALRAAARSVGRARLGSAPALGWDSVFCCAPTPSQCVLCCELCALPRVLSTTGAIRSPAAMPRRSSQTFWTSTLCSRVPYSGTRYATFERCRGQTRATCHQPRRLDHCGLRRGKLP